MEINKASQPVKYSMIESVVNTGLGFVINVTFQTIVFPLVGIHVPLSTNLEIAVAFTFVSIIRQYCLRRAFNYYHVYLLAKESRA